MESEDLGTGGSGEVKTCFHRETNIKRAVKIFRKDLLTNEASKANLEKEINILIMVNSLQNYLESDIYI